MTLLPALVAGDFLSIAH